MLSFWAGEDTLSELIHPLRRDHQRRTNRVSKHLVIFDCDGVLVDSEMLVNRTYVELLRERGFELDEADNLTRFAGTHMPVRLASYERELGWKPEADFRSEFLLRLTTLFKSRLTCVEGIELVLEWLRERDIRICAASNNTKNDVDERLRIVNLDLYFNGNVFGALDLGAPKPLPDVFLHAAKSCGASKENCIVVEDSVTGVRGAVAAGMRVFGYAATTDADELRRAGATPFRTMLELQGLLKAVL